MATGDVQRNRIIESEQGVNNFFLPKRFIFIFVSFLFVPFLFVSGLFRFVSFPFQRNIVSFRELEIYFPFRFVSFQKIMRFLRFFPFRFVSFLNPEKNYENMQQIEIWAHCGDIWRIGLECTLKKSLFDMSSEMPVTQRPVQFERRINSVMTMFHNKGDKTPLCEHFSR
jgi:hypothetical protein